MKTTTRLLFIGAILAAALPLSAADRSPDQFDIPARSISINGTEVTYYEQGSGQPILFVHGIPTWSFLWRNIIPPVSKIGRAIAVDLPGFGASDPMQNRKPEDYVELLEEFINALSLRDIVLVVHDFGAIGLNYAARHTSNVAGVAFMELPIQDWYSETPSPEAIFPTPVSIKQRQLTALVRDEEKSTELIVGKNIFLSDPLFSSSRRHWSPLEKDAYQKPFEDIRRRESLRDLVSNLLLDSQPKAIAQLVREQGKWLMANNVPKLAIVGNPGKFITPRFLQDHLTVIEQLSIVEIDDSIHLLMEDHPEEVAQALTVWLSIHFKTHKGKDHEN